MTRKLNTQFLHSPPPPPFLISCSFPCLFCLIFFYTLSVSPSSEPAPYFLLAPLAVSIALSFLLSPSSPTLTAAVHLLPLPSLIQHHQYTSLSARVCSGLVVYCAQAPVFLFARVYCVCVCLFLCAHIHEGNKHYCLLLNHMSNVYYSQKHKAITLSDETES